MRITQDVRDYADRHGVSADEALQHGMEEKALEFKNTGAQLYRKT